MPDGTDCSNPSNFGRYIEEFRCQNNNITANIVKNMRLSFPSGHSSFTVFTMVYCAVSFTEFARSFVMFSLSPIDILTDFAIVRFVSDLFAVTDDMERLKVSEALHTIRSADDNVVHVLEPNLRLQASLVWCIGRRYDWTSRCHASGAYLTIHPIDFIHPLINFIEHSIKLTFFTIRRLITLVSWAADENPMTNSMHIDVNWARTQIMVH